MGLFICDLCDENLALGKEEKHVCDPEKIRQHITRLREEKNTADCKLHAIRNAVLMLLHELPSLDGDKVEISPEWLRKLWKAAECQWYESKDADRFLVRWIALHRILCEAFDIFRVNRGSVLKRLQDLRIACDHAKEVMGYQDSRLDLTPEDVVAGT